ncbi:integrase, catalytic region, zinc finger, CCHC-type containing protein [Tanacetum coccineum]
MFESIKITRTSTNEKTSSLLTQIEDLKAQLEGNLKVATRSSVKTKVLAPGMYAIDVKPIPHPLKNNRSAHLTYINHLKESVETVREIVEEARVVKPLDNALNYACQYTKLSQELLEYVIGTCPKRQFCDSGPLKLPFRKHILLMFCGYNGADLLKVIVDDYSRFTWVKFLRSKDETPEFVINFLKQIQVGLNKTVRYIRTDNGTEFVNQVMSKYYEGVGIFHQKSIPRTPQQNGVVERRNRTLMEAARTMLIFSKALMFL